MPIVFLFSAIVSGIAMVMLIYMMSASSQGEPDMDCLDKVASFLILRRDRRLCDRGPRLHPSPVPKRGVDQDPIPAGNDETLISLVVLQILLGMLIPLGVMAVVSFKVFN